MPEPSKRVAVTGMKRGESAFQRYLRQRLQSERTIPALERELREAGREADRLLREAQNGS